MKQFKIGELNEMFTESERCDESVFAEMKSNVLLMSGEHYRRTDSTSRTRDQYVSGSDTKQKIRIVKNLTRKVVMTVVDGILGLSPDLKPMPANKAEARDRKAAELHDSVLQYAKNRYKLNEKKEDWCKSFVGVGEVAVKVTWDPNKGDLVGYRQKVIEGVPLFKDQAGKETPLPGIPGTPPVNDPLTGMEIMPGTPEVKHEPLADKEKPVFSGDFCFEDIFPADLRRAPQARHMDDSPYLIHQKMWDIKDAEKLIPENDPDRDNKLAWIKSSSEETFKVFDHNTHSFEDTKGRVLIRQFYFRKCYDFPKGCFIFATSAGVLLQDELPAGVFPIAWRAFEKNPTAPRGVSIIKVVRPYQVEHNRVSSKVVEHQLVHGDDKVISLPGAKMTQEATLPGIRHYKATSQTSVIPGRTGDQFGPYTKSNVEELFFAVNEEMQEQETAQMDPMAILYKHIKRNKRYGRPAREFQAFLKEVYWITLELARHYFDDNRAIRAVGRSEAVNLAEYRNADPLCVQIDLSPSNEDAEMQMGQLLMTQYVLQYVGKDMPPETIAKLLSEMPYSGAKEAFSGMLQTDRNIENDMLALDRGEMVEAQPDDDHAKYIKALSGRMKAPDFRFFDDRIKQAYAMKRDQHRQFEAEQVEALQRAQMGLIPTDGPLTKVDMYDSADPNNPTKIQRKIFPQSSLIWLEQKMDEQLMTQDRLAGLSMADQIAVTQGLGVSAQPPMQAQPNQGGMNVPGIQPV